MRHLALFVILFATSSLAADTRWGLKWKAPDACIGAADLAQAVEQRIGRSLFGSEPQYRVDGTMVEGASPRWKARMTLVSSAGEVLGTRELSGDDADCRALDGRIALAMSLTIEPQLQRKAPEPKPQLMLVGSELPKDAAFLHMDSDFRDARLLRFGGTASGTGYGPRGPTTITITNFIDECRAPCNAVIPRADDRFFIGGSGVTMTNEIILADHQQKNGRVDLKVKAGSAGAYVMGLMSTIWGLIGVGVGLPLMAFGGGGSSGGGLLVAGLISSVAGAALTAIGIPVFLNNRTTVTFDDGTVIH